MNEKKNFIVGLYPRVSTEDQSRYGHSLDEQEESMKKLCDFKGYTIYKIYREEGVSAKSMDRPKFQEMIDDLMDTQVIYTTTNEDKENVAKLLSKYDLFALPVVDNENRMVGIVTIDDAVDVIEDEATEDFEKMAAMLPSDRAYLESLPGVGRKTCNVVLSNLYDVPAIAVDTHVKRVANRLGIVNSDDVLEIENKLMKFFPKDKWSRVHHQLVLFGRYICKSMKPDCDNCPFINKCKYKNNNLD